MIEYRTFRNYDPPALVRLWQQAGLGRGAAQNLTNDSSFDLVNFAQSYFDARGLIVAVNSDDRQPVGFVHAGFGSDATGSGLDPRNGVICTVIVHPDFRRRGIGTELVRRAEAWLKASGATDIHAGPGPGRDPFYFGLYGFAQPSGFLHSDAAAAPFFERLGYTATQQFDIASRRMDDRDPVSFRLTTIRRKWDLTLCERPEPCPWWWMSRFGRLDAIFCVLLPRTGGRPVASCSVVGLDLYIPSWREQSIGIADLWVDERQRRQGLGQCLLIDVIRRLRQETIQRVYASIPAADSPALAVFQSVGFQTIDRGTVYRAPQ